MALPFTPTAYHADLYAALAPLAYDEVNQAYALFKYTGAIAQMHDQIEGYVRDPVYPANPAWSLLMDIDRCPSEALPWLAQFVGVKLDRALSDADQRTAAKNSDGFKRGSLGSMIAAAQKYLTGTKTVYYKERDSAVSAVAGGAYGLTILTLTSETPSSAAVLAALNAVKPAGIILAYNTVASMTYQLLNTNYASYSAVNSAFLTYNGVAGNRPGT